MQLNDCIHAALAPLYGPPDHIHDLLLAYYQANGAVSGHLNDACREFLEAQGATPATLSDMWDEFLTARGYTGHRNDMLHAFWCNEGGAVSLRALRGWAGTENCADFPDSRVTIRFSEEVYFTTQTGITIRNITTGETFDISSVNGEGTNTVEYLGTWTGEEGPLFGETIQWEYDGQGDYESGLSDPLEAQILEIQNCATQKPEFISARAIEISGVAHVEVTFNVPMRYINYAGVIIRADGDSRGISEISGNDTVKITYRCASLNHLNVITWEYTEAAGILVSRYGDALPDVAAQPVSNDLPTQTFWDPVGNEPGTYWDGTPPDETEWDKS